MPLGKAVVERLDAIMAAAEADGRKMLYEHEVYQVLEAMGLTVPYFRYVRDFREMTKEWLDPFPGGNVIVKIVSRDLSHNQKFGGVRKVSVLDPLYVQFVMEHMQEEVLSHFPEGRKPRVDGFLVVEFIKFTQAMGNEMLIGVKEDPAFGPVVTITKGGDDAEFFARCYDPANLVLAPLTYEEAEALAGSLKIRQKYEETGHPEYIGQIARALHQISRLGFQYSNHSPECHRFSLTALDVNPFVFSEDGRFIAVDGYAEFLPAETCPMPGDAADLKLLDRFFAPRGIAVLGVSSKPEKYSMARVIVALLRDMGREDVYCVNPKGGTAEVDGETYPLYRSQAEIPGPYDLVVYAAPAGHSLDCVKETPADKALILISGMPPEMDYTEFSRKVSMLKAPGVRIIGPNCMGVFHAPHRGTPGVNTLFIQEQRLEVHYHEGSNAALFTQSGAMGITSIERGQNAGIFRAVVSFGNKVDVNGSELIAWFERRPEIDVMAMYLEGLEEGEGRRFFDAARRSRKPVIVYKSGRTEAGARAAASHTASMSGSYDVFRAACLQAGCVLTEEMDDFYNFTKAFAMLARKMPQGPKVAGVVNAGLDATMGADTLRFLKPAEFTSGTRDRIQALNTHGLVDTGMSFLDVTPMTDDAAFAGFAEALLADPGVDCLFVAVVPHIENLKTLPENLADPDAIAPLLCAVAKKYGKPVVVSVNAGHHYRDFVKYLEQHGLPVFPDIRSAIRSLETFVAFHLRNTVS